MRRPALAADGRDFDAPHQKAFEAYVRVGRRRRPARSRARGQGDVDGRGRRRRLPCRSADRRHDAERADVDGVDPPDRQCRERRGHVLRRADRPHRRRHGLGQPRPASVTETDTPQIERITIPLHELSALPKASQRLLDDSAFDIEGWLAGRIADKFARAEAAAFVNGDGVDKPRGFLTQPTVDNDDLGLGHRWAMCRPGTDGGFDPLTRPMRSSTWSMRWARSTGRTRPS